MRLGRVAAALSTNASSLRSFLRPSSSLQDLSSYPKPDLECGSPGPDPKPADLARENGSVVFTKPPPVHFLPWRRIVRTGICILSVLLLLTLTTYAGFSYFRTASNYYVVIDCGSTGTRVYVYRWSVNRSNGNDGGLPITLRSLPEGKKWKFRGRSGRAYRRMETEPGFDKLVRNETGLRTAMMPLLRWAEKQIPKDAHESTSVFLYATAGVRRLPKSDSDWLLEKAWSILKNSKFLCRREWVKIISGMEEAYYGWIALNHHMGVLGSLPGKGTFGSLDLGGSSLQVTFENEDAMRDETGLRLSIGMVNHNLNAYSLSGYGLNDAFDKSVVHLLKRFPARNGGRLKDGSIVLKHPCLQTGYKERYVCSRCGTLNHDGSPSSVGWENNRRRRTGVPVKLLGDPNWGECSSVARAVVNLSEWSVRNSGIDCDIQPCALNDKLPWPRGRFYAMSGFFVVFKFFNLSSDATIEDMLHKGHEFCSKSWQAAKSSVASQPFIEQYCFRAPYVASLLRDGLHIGDTQVVVGSGSITWTLGVALLEAGQATSNRMDVSAYNFFQTRKVNYAVLLLVIPVLLLCFLTFSGKWRNIILRRSPIRIFRQYTMAGAAIFNRAYFGVHRWSPQNSGDERVKLPLSPKVAGSLYSFGSKHILRGGSVHLPESSLHVSGSGLSRSYSGGLGQTHPENAMGSFWPPHRNQMQISSRRSLSREDLNSSLSEVHLVKS